MKTYKINFRQTFEHYLQVEVEASSEEAAINKARKLSEKFNSADDADFCSQSWCPDSYGGDDFTIEED